MKDKLEVLKIYGFGSFFKGIKTYKDIDLLIIHSEISKHSCQIAIICKSRILEKIDNIDLSMLSIKEEKSLNFIEKSNAFLLGTVQENDIDTDLKKILENIVHLQSKLAL